MLPAAAQELWKALRKADRKAAKARVVALRKRLPDADNEELHRLLVQSKCLQAGAIGALSAVVELVPGAGKLAGVFLGPVIDIGTVTALQSELVIETFAAMPASVSPSWRLPPPTSAPRTRPASSPSCSSATPVR